MTDEWVAPEVERSEPPTIADERSSLEAWVDYHRATLLRKCAGLTGSDLTARPLPPSGLSLLGLVRHMTEVERWWFRRVADSQELDYVYCDDEARAEADFDETDPAAAEADLARFETEVAAARAAGGRHQLDEVVANPTNPERTKNVRWIYIHMIEEYARHNGHADLIREKIDGVIGE